MSLFYEFYFLFLSVPLVLGETQGIEWNENSPHSGELRVNISPTINNCLKPG